jgi:hypothetical protein
MTHSPYLLFHQTPAQLRRVAARGGRASARNRRQKMRAASAPPPSAVAPTEPHAETVAQAIAALDAQFLWLRGAQWPPSMCCAPRRACRISRCSSALPAGTRSSQQFIALSRYVAIRSTSSSRDLIRLRKTSEDDLLPRRSNPMQRHRAAGTQSTSSRLSLLRSAISVRQDAILALSLAMSLGLTPLCPQDGVKKCYRRLRNIISGK